MSRRAVRTVALAVLVLLLACVAPAVAQTTDTLPTDPAVAPDIHDPCDEERLWERFACEARERVGDGVGGLITVGMSSVFDQMYEWMASSAVWLMEQLVGLIDGTTAPDVGAGWFVGQYRLMGSLAVALVMPLLMVATLVAVVRQDWRGLVKSYFVYVPAAMLATAVAVPLVDRAVAITDWMSLLFFDGLREDIHAFTATVAEAMTVTTVATGGGAAAASSAAMLLGAGVIALAAFAVWVELVLRSAGIYVALFFLPLGFAALVWPATRKWCGRLVKALVALILSKFVIVAVIALAAGALGNMGGPDGAGFAGVVAGSTLMLMAAFSPLVLFRLADVAGDELAGAVEGATQHRTSPVPTPQPQQSAARVYGRIMQSRVARDGAGGGMAAGKAASAGGATAATGGAAAATGGAAAAVGAGVKAVTAPKAAGQAAGERLGETTASARGPAAGADNGARPAGERGGPPSQAGGPTASRSGGEGPPPGSVSDPPADPRGGAPAPPGRADPGQGHPPPPPSSPPRPGSSPSTAPPPRAAPPPAAPPPPPPSAAAPPSAPGPSTARPKPPPPPPRRVQE